MFPLCSSAPMKGSYGFRRAGILSLPNDDAHMLATQADIECLSYEESPGVMAYLSDG